MNDGRQLVRNSASRSIAGGWVTAYCDPRRYERHPGELKLTEIHDPSTAPRHCNPPCPPHGSLPAGLSSLALLLWFCSPPQHQGEQRPNSPTSTPPVLEMQGGLLEAHSQLVVVRQVTGRIQTGGLVRPRPGWGVERMVTPLLIPTRACTSTSSTFDIGTLTCCYHAWQDPYGVCSYMSDYPRGVKMR